MSTLGQDFRDLLVALHDAGAEFLLVGGHAVGFHGFVRATKDMDVLVRTSPTNAERVYAGLASWGAPIDAFEVGVEDFVTYEGWLTMGVAPNRIDVLSQISGVSFDDACVGAGTLKIEGRPIRVIGLEALIRNKRAAGRPQDLRDIEALESRRG